MVPWCYGASSLELPPAVCSVLWCYDAVVLWYKRLLLQQVANRCLDAMVYWCLDATVL